MNNKSPIAQLIAFAVYFLVQIIFFRDVWILSKAYCWIYVAPLILLPTYVKDYVLLLVAFALGVSVDVMYDKVGVNAAACVFLAFIRPIVIRLMADSRNDDVKEFNLKSLGFRSFSVYAILLLSGHHLVVFLINSASSEFLLRALSKTLFSVVFTFIMILSVQMLYYTRRGKR